MTSKPLPENPDNSKLLQLDFHAKIYPWLANSEASEKAQDQDSFMKSLDYLGKFNLNLSSLKTLEIYSLTKRGKLSKKSSFKLPKQGMMLNGQLFQQEMWEAATFENVCGSLPTPNTMDYLPPRGLDSMIKQTQTHRKGRKKLGNLREAVNPETVELFNKLQNLPTPCSRDYKDAGKNLNFKKIAEKGKLSGVLNHTYSTLTGKGTYLNPPFVEEMMGYPIGWTDYAPSETA